MKEIQSICVYCSASDQIDEVYKKAAIELGEHLARKGISLVYGGSTRGLMGLAANTAMDNGGRVIGYMPEHLQKFEEPNWGITELHLVDSMHTRKRLMFERSDAFFVMPGGFGTLDETFEIVTWRQLQLHEKPVVFININDYWKPLQKMAQNIFNQGFARSAQRSYFCFVESVEQAFISIEDKECIGSTLKA